MKNRGLGMVFTTIVSAEFNDKLAPNLFVESNVNVNTILKNHCELRYLSNSRRGALNQMFPIIYSNDRLQE